LANATRHTGPGGLVVVAVAAEPDAVRIDVRDTGEGVAPEELPRVFERFYRAQGADGTTGTADGAAGAGGATRGGPGEGAGLGLTLVKELTEAMGGSVAAMSTPGEGSCFSVRLPRA
jgi:two-component system sensor histidine kinase BaeS